MVAPCGTSMGSEPGGSLTSSKARPGQRKPESGQSIASALPVGAHWPGCTGRHAASLVAPVVLLYVPPSHGRGELEPLGQ